jgi:hypothetical protein
MPACWIGTVQPTNLVNRVASIGHSVLRGHARLPDNHQTGLKEWEKYYHTYLAHAAQAIRRRSRCRRLALDKA